MSGTFTLQILHGSDFEAATAALTRAKNFAAIVDKLEDLVPNSITLSSGDNFIPGPFNAAQTDPSLKAGLQAYEASVLGVPAASLTGIAPAQARLDIAILNSIGIQATVAGNHDFDFGPTPLTDAIAFRKGATTAASTPAQLAASVQFTGAQFPYVDANLDFSKDASTGALYTTALRDAASFATRPSDLASNAALTAAAADKEIVPYTYITVNGERIGLVGVTTQVLKSVSSPGNVTVLDPAGDGGVDNMNELAGIIQPYVDSLTAAGINKVVLLAHLQEYQNEFQLATLLKNVDVIVAGGSHALFDNASFTTRPGDIVQQGYPVLRTGADGKPVEIINTQNEYSYVGRLVATFDANGVIIPSSIDPTVSGNYVTTDAAVQALYGSVDPYAAGTRGGAVKALTDSATAIITVKDGSLLGASNVYLQGQRTSVRTEETNLGDLTADANLFVARQLDPTVAISIKNGGGIRAEIGGFTTGARPVPIPPIANPDANKPAGFVSQLDNENSLRFNNALSVVTVTAANLQREAEFLVGQYGPGLTPGGAGQIGGMALSYDPNGTAQVINASGVVTTVGTRVKSLAVLNDDGSIKDLVVQNGAVVGDAARTFKIATLGFIADGGDGNPLNFYGTDRVNLDKAGLPAGAFNFAAPGTEQDALAEYLKAQYGDARSAYGQAETGGVGDLRIENLTLRADAVNQKVIQAQPGSGPLVGDAGSDRLIGGTSDDVFVATLGRDTVSGGTGFDVLRFNGVGRGDGGMHFSGTGGRIDGFDWVANSGASGQTRFDGIERVDMSDGRIEFTGTELGAEVARLYRGILGRDADAKGLAVHVDVAAKLGLTADAGVLLGSTEGRAANAGLSDAAFVAKLYQGELGRAGETAGTAYWIGKLAAGASRAEVAAAFTLGTEALTDAIGVASKGLVVGSIGALDAGHAYQGVLGRQAEAGGLAYWTGQVAAGASEADLVRAYATSSEFTAKYGALGNADFVAQAYQNQFGHAADAAGAAFWTGKLAAGATRADVEVGLELSMEGDLVLQRLAITGLDLL